MATIRYRDTVNGKKKLIAKRRKKTFTINLEVVVVFSRFSMNFYEFLR